MSIVNRLEKHTGCPVTGGAHADAGNLTSHPGADVEPAAVGVDLGSGRTRIWASGRPLLQSPTLSDSPTNPIRPIQHGRITDATALERLLRRLLRRHHRPVPVGATVVSCRPVLSTADEQAATRRLLTDVFAPSRVLFVDTVRAAAIGAGAAPGPLLVADIGAHLTEVAVVAGGTVTAARRADLGVRDMTGLGPNDLEPIVGTVASFVAGLQRDPRCRDVPLTAGGGLLLVGGAAQPTLAARIAAETGMAVRLAPVPHLAAVQGAGLAALAALRRAAATGD